MFDRPTHQAIQRRAKQDEIQNKIVEKFDQTAVESKKNALIKEGSSLNDSSEAILARDAHRKEIEAQTKQALDLQLLNHEKAKQKFAAEKKAEYDQVQRDVKKFEEDE